MKTFLDDEWQPPEKYKADFQAGIENEKKHAASAEEVARWKAVADDIGRKMAAGFREVIKEVINEDKVN